MNTKLNLKALSEERIYNFIKDLALPDYRGSQILHWIYKKYASSIEEITEFSKNLRKKLSELAYISNLKCIKRLYSVDGTEKYLFSLEDSQIIESVLIPDTSRLTLCISSQVGCSMKCYFCRTGKSGFIRNLKAYEIVDQIIAVNKIINPKEITNIVFMGMGEPLANFKEVVEALWRIVKFIGISKKRITLSTVGIVPLVLLLPKKAPDIKLAISLNATTNETRSRLMPINKRYPIESIITACREYPLKNRDKITFEYIMIDGVNDSKEDAFRLIKMLKGIRCKVNLIPLNPFEGLDLKCSPYDKILEFQRLLLKNGIRAFIRKSKGQDIFAACGQLRAENLTNILTETTN